MTLVELERVAAGLLLLAAAWPAFGPLASRQFWRAFPRLALPLAALVAVAVAGAVLAAVWAPLGLLRGLAAGAAAWLAALAWHGAVRRGKARGWPPGSLRLLPLGPWFDRDFFRVAAQRHGSPFKASQFLRPMACIVGLGEGHELLRRQAASLDSPPMAFGRFIPGGFLRHMPAERHREAKAVLAAAFDHDVADRLEPLLRDTLRAALAGLATASALAAGRGAPPRRHIQRGVFTAWARLFFGFAPGSPETERLRALYRIVDIRNPAGASDGAVRAALAEIAGLVRARLPGAGASGPATSYLAAMATRRPGSADDPAILTNLVYILHTTWADVSGLLVWVLRLLGEHPAWAERLGHGRGGDDGEPPLATRIVLETLRLEQSEYLYRVAREAIEHGGHVIPRGWLVRICVQESHRDPATFERPHEFDPDRFLGRSYARHQYSPFGAGSRHACLGDRLTLRVGGLFAEELCRGFRWRTVADGPPEQSAWRHWRPSSAWRVAMEAVE